MKKWGCKHLTSPTYHPASNGLAERNVQSFKIAVKTGITSSNDIDQVVQKWLFRARTTPLTCLDGHSPAKTLLGYQLTTKLSRSSNKFQPGDPCLSRARPGAPWKSGTVERNIGDSLVAVRHHNQVIPFDPAPEPIIPEAQQLDAPGIALPVEPRRGTRIRKPNVRYSP